MRTPEENRQERQPSLLENIGVPTWPAYSAAVWALSGRMTTSPVPPRRVSSPRNEVMDACSVDMMRA